MAVTWTALRTRVYGFTGLSTARVASTKVDEYLLRGFSKIADLSEQFPQLWDALIALEYTRESDAIDANGVAELPESYLKLHRDMTVRGRSIRVVNSVANRQRIQDDFNQPTTEEPWAEIVPSSDEERSNKSIKITPTKFTGEKVTYRYLAIPTESTEVSDESAELIVAASSLIALEELSETGRAQKAAQKFAEELLKFKVVQK